MRSRTKWSVGFVVLFALELPVVAWGQIDADSPSDEGAARGAFRQLDELLPAPNIYRTASGAPGHAYWQQQVDYQIDVRLDDQHQRLSGRERITYWNRSPDTLRYLWLQLDANIYRPEADAVTTAPAPPLDRVTYRNLGSWLARQAFDGGVNIRSVQSEAGKPLSHTVVKTMMRVDLAHPLAPQRSVKLDIEWDYQINNCRVVRGRAGYEHFPEDGNYIYEIAQWFPRLAPYTDAHGWQHKQYLGSGEFALEFGNYLVRITVPNDHIVGATGVLINPDEVLTDGQRKRLNQAATAKRPVFIVTPEEARANERSKPTGEKTWIFRAERVRDFAFASSRKFIWDALGHQVEAGNRVMAMSLYPKEGEPLWSKYSTQAIVHTLDVYSRHTFPYPYPVAYSVNGPVGGMEYPMICFNGPRPEKDGTYSKRTKYGLISVVIHEVGHNFFPMIVSSDERQWMWMDEGFNTFLQYLAEQQWEDGYPSRRGEPQKIVDYMRGPGQDPIMTASDAAVQLHNNAYAKTATGLNILRETILGRELFDQAFKEYARRWMFKHPMPADFFRTMEDASGMDLDWFFRGWFYTTAHTDISIDRMRLYRVDSQNPDEEKALRRKQRAAEPETLSRQRNGKLPKRVDILPELKDFYNAFDELAVTEQERADYRRRLAKLSDKEKQLLATRQYFYLVDFSNLGGLVMPIILEIEYQDGSQVEIRIPAEIWRRDNSHVAKLVITTKAIKSLVLDPHRETADTDLENNYFPRRIEREGIELYKTPKGKNTMQTQSAAARKKGK